ncbi:MAG: hypothetical protein Q9174_006950 [Haloplaca sp. 1 TL-2023]
MHLLYVFSSALSLTLPFTSAVVYKGFNYGAGIDFLTSFRTAQALAGTSGFTSARIYTMIEANTVNSPTSAISAAITTRTTLLLGLYCSAGDLAFLNETIALTAAIEAYGQPFVDLIAGVSIGSEDLYRASPVGIENNSPPGDTAQNIVKYISQTRAVLNNTKNGIATQVPVGHVDTWQMWQSAQGISDIIAAIDFIGVDAYPYWQKDDDNTPDNGRTLFDEAYEATVTASQGKPVWVTEAGWPVNGSTFGQAEPNVENAKRFWDDVGCSKLFDKVNTWWYTLQDLPTADGAPSFGITNAIDNTTALFDLSCPGNGTALEPSGVGIGTISAVVAGSTSSASAASTTTCESGSMHSEVKTTSTARSSSAESTTYTTSTVTVAPTPPSNLVRHRRWIRSTPGR